MSVVTNQPASSSKHSLSMRLWELISGQHEKHMMTQSACQSVVGGRTENQDRCFCDDRVSLYLVVDGIGGHKGGSLASDIVMEAFRSAFKPNDSLHSHDEMEQALHNALISAHRQMASVAKVREEYGKMGCTLAVAAVVEDRLFYAHIGDSRVYRLHHGRIEQLTRDESLVEELLDANLIHPTELANHRWKHVVTNSLSARGIEHEPHWQELKLEPGDQLLLTSDGLTNELDILEIARKLRHASCPEDAVESLIQEALQRNASDNVSCVVTKITRDTEPCESCRLRT